MTEPIDEYYYLKPIEPDMDQATKERIEELYNEALNRLRDCKPPFDERAQHHSALFDHLKEFKKISISLHEQLKQERNKLIDECTDRMQEYFDKVDKDKSHE